MVSASDEASGLNRCVRRPRSTLGAGRCSLVSGQLHMSQLPCWCNQCCRCKRLRTVHLVLRLGPHMLLQVCSETRTSHTVRLSCSATNEPALKVASYVRTLVYGSIFLTKRVAWRCSAALSLLAQVRGLYGQRQQPLTRKLKSKWRNNNDNKEAFGIRAGTRKAFDIFQRRDVSIRLALPVQ
jgi:hypothetical protein